MTNPAALAARPDSEFKREITTGISPPPIGITAANPKISDSTIEAIIKAMQASKFPTNTNMAETSTITAANKAFTAFCPA